MKRTNKGRLELKKAGQKASPGEPVETRDEKNTDADERDETSNNYYIMTREEADALVHGDMKTVERWVNNLDRSRATWLLRWLIKKKGMSD